MKKKMKILRQIRIEEYNRGYHDGMIAGIGKGFDRGIKKGINEIEKFHRINKDE